MPFRNIGEERKEGEGRGEARIEERIGEERTCQDSTGKGRGGEVRRGSESLGSGVCFARTSYVEMLAWN